MRKFISSGLLYPNSIERTSDQVRPKIALLKFHRHNALKYHVLLYTARNHEVAAYCKAPPGNP